MVEGNSSKFFEKLRMFNSTWSLGTSGTGFFRGVVGFGVTVNLSSGVDVFIIGTKCGYIN